MRNEKTIRDKKLASFYEKERERGFIGACLDVAEKGLEWARTCHTYRDYCMSKYCSAPGEVAYWDGYADAVVWFV